MSCMVPVGARLVQQCFCGSLVTALLDKPAVAPFFNELLSLIIIFRKEKSMYTLFAMDWLGGFLPEHFWGSLAVSGIFGVLGIVLLLLGYWLFDAITPRIDVQKELCEKNMAVAAVVAALILGIAYMVAHVVQ